jgi:hypothetical protein
VATLYAISDVRLRRLSEPGVIFATVPFILIDIEDEQQPVLAQN